MKKYLLIIFLLVILAIEVFAISSANYQINPDNVASGGNRKSSSSYIEVNSAGEPAWGVNTSANFLNYGGFISALVGAGDIIPPSIGNVQFDGTSINNNDYVKNNAVLTATVLDIGSSISQEASKIVVDSGVIYFSSSNYDPITGALSLTLNNLADGGHTVTITAYDTNNNYSTYFRSVRVDSSDLKVASAYIYPNPFNPNSGPARIAYELNTDINVTLYLFNEINQPVWKYYIPAGSPGGKAGYNEVEWSGVTNFGNVAANGIYFLRITAGGRVLGKIKVAVLK